MVQCSGEFVGTFIKYIVGLQYFTLIKVKRNDCNVEPSMAFLRWTTRVWVDKFFDLTCWWGPKVTPFLEYSAKLGQKWITNSRGSKETDSRKMMEQNSSNLPRVEHYLAQT